MFRPASRHHYWKDNWKCVYFRLTEASLPGDVFTGLVLAAELLHLLAVFFFFSLIVLQYLPLPELGQCLF